MRDPKCELCQKASKMLEDRLPVGGWIIIFVFLLVVGSPGAWASLREARADYVTQGGSLLAGACLALAYLFFVIIVALDIVAPAALIRSRGFRRFFFHFRKNGIPHVHLVEPVADIYFKEKISGLRGRSRVVINGTESDSLVVQIRRRGDSTTFDVGYVNIFDELKRVKQRLVLSDAAILLDFLQEAERSGLTEFDSFLCHALADRRYLEATCVVLHEITEDPRYIRSPYGRFLSEGVAEVSLDPTRSAEFHHEELARARKRLIPLADRYLVHRKGVKAKA